jgi:two-component system, chemotaxis family, chemotaxis protein CheY
VNNRDGDLMSESLAQSEAAAPQNKKVNLRKITILIVDPNEFARTFIRSICRNLHFGNILTTGTTSEAFDLMRANRVQIIVCDWSLEPLSATDFVKQLRSSQDIPDNAAPVIILTSAGSPEAIVAARDAGVDDYLTRPIVMRRLLNSFVSVLCMPRIYIKSQSYIGPCRRRKKAPFNGTDRRSATAANKNVSVGPSAPLLKAEEKTSAAAATAPQPDAKTAQAGGAPPEEKETDLSDTSLDEMEKAGEAAIAQESDNYSKVRLDDIAEIFNLVRAIKQPDAPMKQILDGIYGKAMDVKGMGNTFGFPLLTKVGELLCGFVRGADPESFKVLAKLQVVETHAIIMKMIVDSNMHDEKDELAVEMIGELLVMVDKFRTS